MSARLLRGKQAAGKLLAQVEERTSRVFRGRSVRPPSLAVTAIGDDPAGSQYLRALRRVAERVGVEIRVHRLPPDTGQRGLEEHVRTLGEDASVDGVQVIKPIPNGRHVSEILAVAPAEKDVEGVHPLNIGLLVLGRPRFIPCTAAAVMILLEHHGIDVSGRRAVVIGRSDSVGKPTASLLLARHATVTVCHSITADLEDEVRRADVLVTAIGRPELIRGEWVKPGAVVIDLGHHVLEGGRTVGDCEASAAERAAALTPVPGGAGPITVAVLMSNVLVAAAARRERGEEV